jgi:ParB family chromosome partitioning protein
MVPQANYSNAIFWIEVEKIKPNPYQPRKEFNEDALQSLSESVRQYGILQPLVVTRRESSRADGGFSVEYELIAGERRLRAAKLAGLSQVPALIRAREDSDMMKLELAIIENLQREDLNPIDRAQAFSQLAEQFKLKHIEIAEKIGKSREYVSNSIRLLGLPEYAIAALREGKINEGHTRPLLMLVDRPVEQRALFDDILARKLTVREAESLSRHFAQDKVRKREKYADQTTKGFEAELAEALGTRVQIEKRAEGGKITIDFFSEGDLEHIIEVISRRVEGGEPTSEETVGSEEEILNPKVITEEGPGDDDLYSVRHFTL